MAKRPKLILIDGKALFYRAYHALGNLTSPDGLPTGGVYGFAQMVLKAYADLKPDYAILCWDKAKTALSARLEMYAEYKAKRKVMPDDFKAQLPYIKEFADAMGLPVVELDGYEADDIIGTIVEQADPNLEIIIVTNDRDIFQLLGNHPGVFIYMQRRGMTDTEIFDAKKAYERYGMKPDQVVDYKALAGDASDNIPGVPGIGDKTALILLQQYQTLDGVYRHLEEIPGKVQDKLRQNQEQAYLSQRLATIMRDAPYKLELEKVRTGNYDRPALHNLFRTLGFKSLLDKLPGASGGGQGTLFEGEQKPAKREHIEGANYICVSDEKALSGLVEKLSAANAFAFDVETDSLDTLKANLVGMAVSFKEGEAFYIPVGHRNQESGTGNQGQLQLEAVVAKLKPVLEDPKSQIVGHNLKFDYEVMRKHGVRIANIAFDTMVAGFILNPLARTPTLSDLAFRELGIEMIPIEELIGRGKNQTSFDLTNIEDATRYAAEDADVSFRLYQKLKPDIDRHFKKLAEETEWPLIPVLAEMELAGFTLDKDFLKKLNKDVSAKILNLEKHIFELAGMRFNINAPAQLSEVLYNKLNLVAAGVRKGKTGSLSTAARELDKLKGLHPIIDDLMEYRELMKLKTTYIDALPLAVADDGRIHTSFSQTITQTGRLNSINPNLQNIPVRTELGRQIRRAFVAPKGRMLVGADYSQIELRVAAALSRDPDMIKAFEEGIDIHARTAAELFNVPLEKVTKEQRYAAKTINFGVLYGMGPHRLTQETEMDHQQATEFIERYFALRPKLKEFIDKTLADARKNEYVETLFGRRRPCPEINSNNFMLRSAAERMAVNVPIQGTATGDLMKLAMIALAPKLEGKADLLLQIHDELIAECNEKDANEVAKTMKETMEGIYDLGVPLVAETSIGTNWDELK